MKRVMSLDIAQAGLGIGIAMLAAFFTGGPLAGAPGAPLSHPHLQGVGNAHAVVLALSDGRGETSTTDRPSPNGSG